MSKNKKPEPNNTTGPTDFDAVAAADELAASLGLGKSPQADQPGDSPDKYIQILESEVEQLTLVARQKDEELKRARVAADDARGEVERIKQRLQRESNQVLERRTHKILNEFLEVLDDLDRAISGAQDTDHREAVVEGVQLVRKSFLKKLAEFGVTHQPALGEAFDPARHDAISSVPVPDHKQHGKIIAVISEGYAIGDDTLRPARVAVGKAG